MTTVADLPERLGSRVRLEDRCHATPCWVWTGVLNDGYGQVYCGGGRGTSPKLVHRLAYELLVGPIPDGLTIDHLCRVRACLNPAHLEPVARGENTLRGLTITAANAAKSQCKHGHPFTPDNTYVLPSGDRECRTCRRATKARYRARQRVNHTEAAA